MMMLHPLMEAVRNEGTWGRPVALTCMSRISYALTEKMLSGKNPFISKAFQ